MKLHFYHRERGFIPHMIRYFTSGYYNHVSIEAGGHYYEALGGRFLGTNGVVMSPDKYSYHRGKYKPNEVATIKIFTDNERAVVKFLNEQVGKKYDNIGVLGYVFKWLRGRLSDWYCSELAARAIEIAIGVEYKGEIDPTELYNILLSSSEGLEP